MPYNSGAVATERSGLVSYKMPVTTSRYSSTGGTSSSSYRTTSSDRPYYSSATGSYTRSTIPRSYSIDTKSTYTSGTSSLQNRTSSLTSHSRQSSLSEDSGISSRSSFSSSSSRDRDTSRESSVSSFGASSSSSGISRSRDSSTKSRYSTDTTASTGTLARRQYGSTLSTSVDADLYNKYSPANYVPNSDIGRPPLRSTTTSCLDSERATTPKTAIRVRNTKNAEADTAPVSSTYDYGTYGRTSRSAGLAVGGCSATAERRVRNKSTEEVIITSKNNNNEVGNKEVVVSDEDTGSEDSCERTDNDDDNGNERRLSVAEIRRRFDAGPDKINKETSPSPTSSAQANGLHESVSKNASTTLLNNNKNSDRQNGFGNGRAANSSVSSLSDSNATRFSPSPNVVRKVYSNPERDISSSDDESDRNEPGEDVMSSRQQLTQEASTSGSQVPSGSPATLRHRGASSTSPNNLSSSPKPSSKYQRSTWLTSDDSDTDASGSSSRARERSQNSSAAAGSLGLVGIRNLGNTCFMNSVVQCLSNTKPLKQYLLDNGHLADLNTSISEMKGSLIKAFATVIQELWDPNATIVSPNGFKSQIGRFAPRFNNYNQQDAQEFLRYLLEGLHEDVNRVKTKPARMSESPDNLLSNDQKAAEYWKRYLRFDNSKIVDIFVGQLCSTLRCTVCQHSSLTFDPFWDLSLPLPTRTGTLKLQQCFDHFTKEEVLDGDEKPTCAKCQMRRKCTKSLTIQKFPKILVLHLKRFSPNERYRAKLSVPVTFPLDSLDLSSYAESKDKNCHYRLYGIANHSGTTYSGHYMAYCKHPVSGDWHQYNDTRVSSISTSQLVSSEAYVLFYEQISS